MGVNMINNSIMTKKINIYSLISSIGLLYIFIFMANSTLKQLSYANYITYICVVILYMIAILRKRFTINHYMLWVALFIGFTIFSSLWAINSQVTFNRVYEIIVYFSVTVLITTIVRSKEDLYWVLNLYVVASLFTGIYVISFVDISVLGSRIGADTGGWNPNSVGLLMAFSILLTVFLIKNTQGKNFFYYVAIVLFIYLTVFTGSRKAIFVILFSSSFYYLLLAKKNKFGRLILVALIAVLFLYFLLNIPALYSVIGVRIEGLFAQYTGAGEIEMSAAIRMDMIERGKKWFLQKPFLGYGLNNFSVLYGDSYTYAHNNYIDLLVGMGILGCTIYYSFFVYIFKKSLKRIKKVRNLSALALTLVITIALNDIGLVSYLSFMIQFLLCMAYKASTLRLEDDYEKNI